MPLNFIAKIGIQLAISAASMALNMTRKIEGPRLDSLKFTSGDYGAALQMTWGKRRHECPIFWAEDLKEVKQQRKTKGGKYNDYTYYGTWAIALAGHEISGVTRIWLDTHLVYDITGAGPITAFDFGPAQSGGKGGGSAGAGGFAINDHMAIYYGTEDQEPDPRMMATVEAEFGEGSCPAYRGTAYIAFKDLPLEKLGNRIPQVSVEVVTAATGIIPTEQRDYDIEPNPRWDLMFSSDYSRLAWMASSGGGFEVWDVAARAQMISMSLPGYTISTAGYFGVYNNGDMLAVNGGHTVNRITIDGVVEEVLYDSTVNRQQLGCAVVADGAGNEHWGTYPYSFYERWFFDGVLYEPGWQACLYFADTYGNVWVVGREVAVASTTDQVYFKRLVTVDNTPGYLTEFVVTMPDTQGPGGNGDGVWAAASGGNFICDWANKLHLIDPTDGSLISSHTATARGHQNSVKTVWSNFVPGAGTIWRGDSEYDILTGELIRTVAGIPASSGQNPSVYDPINHALWVSENDITIYYLDRISGDGVTLGTIAADVADMVGVEDYSFTALDQVVQGWSATQGQASNMLEPLLDAYDSDIRPHDFTIQGVKRTGVSTGTILTERFVKADPRYSVKVRQSAELPRAVIVTFADMDADQQPNTARADRPLDATGAKGEQSIDMGTWATDADEARQLTDRFHRRIWNERKEVSNALTAQQLKLEPADVQTLDLDGESDIYRLVRLTVKANGELATEWKYDHPSLAVIDATAGANFDGRNPSVIVVPLISKGFVLDIPLISDVDDQSTPAVYLLAAPFISGTWPGAVVYQAIGGEYSDEIGSVASAAPATWGHATELPYANPNIWDRGSSITVTLQYGSLTGTTEAAIDANPMANLAAIGAPGMWEIVNFTTATLGAPNTYTVSGFKRGRRGTEWAAELHTSNDQFVMLSTAEDAAMGLSEVATDLSFKAVTSGRTEAGAFQIDLSPFTGASLKPYAPCQLTAAQDSTSGDWTLDWIRRTRVGGAWTGGAAIPLSEASEEYEVEILDADDEVIRTYSGLTSPTTSYTNAHQVADFGVVVEEFGWRVYQISDAVGRGFVAEGQATAGFYAGLNYVGAKTVTVAGDTVTSTTVSLDGLTGGARSSIRAGDLVIGVFASSAPTTDVTLSISDGTTAYTLIGSELYSDDSLDINLRAAYKIMSSSPDANIVFGPVGDNAGSGAFVVYVFSGVDQSTPMDVAATTATGINGGNADPPSITPSTAGARIVAVGAGCGALGNTGDFSSSDLSKFVVASKGSVTDYCARVGVGQHVWTSGAFNPAAFTGGDASSVVSWAAITFALRPA